MIVVLLAHLPVRESWLRCRVLGVQVATHERERETETATTASVSAAEGTVARSASVPLTRESSQRVGLAALEYGSEAFVAVMGRLH